MDRWRLSAKIIYWVSGELTSNSRGHSRGWAVQHSDSTNTVINNDVLCHILRLETIVHLMIIHLHLVFGFCFLKDEEFGLMNAFNQFLHQSSMSQYF